MQTRRDVMLLGSAAALVTELSYARWAHAQALSGLRVFVPAAPGSGLDKLGRLIGQTMHSGAIIKDIGFENMPGAGGATGIASFHQTMKGRGDALLVGGLGMINSVINNKAAVSLKDLAPIARLTGEFEVVVASAQGPHKSMQDALSAMKTDPSRVSWAVGSPGGTDHAVAGLITRAAGIELKGVKFVTHPSDEALLAALSANPGTLGISGWGDLAEHIKSGKLRALAITADKRQSGIDVPTLKEQGIDVALYSWRGVFAAPDLPAAQQGTLHAAVESAVKAASWRQAIEKNGWIDLYQHSAEFKQQVDRETTQITGILKELGLLN